VKNSKEEVISKKSFADSLTSKQWVVWADLLSRHYGICYRTLSKKYTSGLINRLADQMNIYVKDKKTLLKKWREYEKRK